MSFSLDEGETLGLVGESGSGKTTTCLSIVGLLPRGARIVGGSVVFDGEDLTRKSQREMRRVRGRPIAMILQDPMASLNPLFTISDQVAEPAFFHQQRRGRTLRAHVHDLLGAVRIPSPEWRMREYPAPDERRHAPAHRRRHRAVGRAAAWSSPTSRPPTSTSRSRRSTSTCSRTCSARPGVALIFVTHNLGIVAKMCDRVAVMYAGKIVEQAPVRELFDAPKHPYTRALLGSVPRLGSKEPLYAIAGQPPNLASLPPGCAFHPRCPEALPRCMTDEPGDFHLETMAASPGAGCSTMATPVLEVRGLTKHFPVRRGCSAGGPTWVKAVDGIDFAIEAGETLGLVGESGLRQDDDLQAVPAPGAADRGDDRLRGPGHRDAGGADLMAYRRAVQAVFQDPFSSLSPRMRVRDIIAEPLEIHADLSTRGDPASGWPRSLELVGLQPDVASLFPHEFSGGQRQRIAIARALATDTRLIMLDEPVSALDVSIRAQIMNLLEDLQQTLGVSYLFIGHDLATVAHISHRIAVMYLGKIVESADSDTLCARPLHPYTKALFAAALPSHPDDPPAGARDRGRDPERAQRPVGLPLPPRCPAVMPHCSQVQPELQSQNGHQVACHLY